MKIIDPLCPHPELGPTVVTIGNFDGVHSGHALLLEKVCSRAREIGARSVVLTFVPHTRAVLAPGKPLNLLTLPLEKNVLLGQAGVDVVAELAFSKEIAALGAKAFYERILKTNLNVADLVVGEGHLFGNPGQTDVNQLREELGRNHFSLFTAELLTVNGTVVSSTAIRQQVAAGEVRSAVAMLGHPYLIAVEHIRGVQRGTAMGFPTLNFALPKSYKIIAPAGVYAARLQRGDFTFTGALYMGNCPTFDNGMGQAHFEFHAFEYNDAIRNCSGPWLLWVYHYLRPDKVFADTASLVVQIKQDIESIRYFFSQE